LKPGDATAACERPAGRLRPAPTHLHHRRHSRGAPAARPGGRPGILSEGGDLSSRPLRGMDDREVDLRAGNMVEVVGEDVHGDRGDDLDDLLIATPAARSVATSLVGR